MICRMRLVAGRERWLVVVAVVLKVQAQIYSWLSMETCVEEAWEDEETNGRRCNKIRTSWKLVP